MRNVIFVINNLGTGGVQSSLLNLLAELHEKYHITVLCFDERIKKASNVLPPNVDLVVANSPFRFFGVSQRELQGNPAKYLARACWTLLTKLFGRSFAIRMMLPFQKELGDYYDCAISYLHEAAQNSFYGGCNEFVLKKIKAKKKVTWLHCDFELCGANSQASEKIYQQFDEIVACSEGTKRVFLRCMPQFRNKCVAIRNCHNYRNICWLAGDGIPYDKSKFNIVTVARLSEEKGIERALEAVKCCIKKGYKLHYHIVGSGNQEEHLKELTGEYELENAVTFYGNQSNPYPYIKNADLFLLPSYHEAAPMVFDEAACLGVPVLATETTSTDEMIIESGSGFVCENSQDGIDNGLMDVLKNPDILVEIKRSLEKRQFTNQDNINKVSEVINDEHL